MSLKQAIAITAMLALAPLAVHADACDNAQDQLSMNRCAQQALEASELELSRLSHEIARHLDDEAGDLLMSAQQAWTAFRDAECAFSSSGSADGSIYPMVRTMCLDALTQARIEDFRQYLACPEGDLSCPVPTAD